MAPEELGDRSVEPSLPAAETPDYIPALPAWPDPTTELCRYCLMCRHVCPVTRVTGNEATSPHGWALLIASVQRQLIEWNEDTVDLLYQCADCGLCQAHCVTDQPLPLTIEAARAGVVDQKLAPPAVYELQDRLQRWGNPYRNVAPEAVSASGETALVVGAGGYHLEPATVSAAVRLLGAAKADVVTVAAGRASPYLAMTLGLLAEARVLASDTLEELAVSGARRAFFLGPGDAYTFGSLLPHLGLDWPAEVELLEATDFLAGRLRQGELAFSPAELSDSCFFDPDHTVRRPGRFEAPRELLQAVGCGPLIELFWRQERAAPCGASGGLPFTQPELALELARATLNEAQNRGIQTLITDDPEVLHHLRRSRIDDDPVIVSLYELLAEQLVEPGAKSS